MRYITETKKAWLQLELKIMAMLTHL